MQNVLQKWVFNKKLFDNEVNYGQKSKPLKKLEGFLTAGGEDIL